MRGRFRLTNGSARGARANVILHMVTSSHSFRIGCGPGDWKWVHGRFRSQNRRSVWLTRRVATSKWQRIVAPLVSTDSASAKRLALRSSTRRHIWLGVEISNRRVGVLKVHLSRDFNDLLEFGKSCIRVSVKFELRRPGRSIRRGINSPTLTKSRPSEEGTAYGGY